MNIPVDIDLHAAKDFFGDHRLRANGEWRVDPHQVVKRLHQLAQDQALQRREIHQCAQMGKTVDATRQHRIRGLDRFDETREADCGRAVNSACIRQRLKTRRGFGNNALLQATGIIFVLGGDDDRGVRTRQSKALGQRGGDQRAEVLVVADDAVDAPAVFACQPVDITARIKGQQPRIVGKPEEIKAFVVKPVAGLVTRVIEFHPVPVFGEQHQYVSRFHASLRKNPLFPLLHLILSLGCSHKHTPQWIIPAKHPGNVPRPRIPCPTRLIRRANQALMPEAGPRAHPILQCCCNTHGT